MSRMALRPFLVVLVLSYLLSSCGGGGSPTAPTAPPPSSAPPAPAPTPTPNPTNPNDPRAGLPDGPVVRYTIKLRSIDTGEFSYREPSQDEEGNWIVYPGEFVVFDSTQKNANGDICKWKDDPVWKLTDPGSVFSIRGSSNPFLLRVDIAARGAVVVQASVDGVESNVLNVLSVKKN